jgi:hypothetical protein
MLDIVSMAQTRAVTVRSGIPSLISDCARVGKNREITYIQALVIALHPDIISDISVPVFPFQVQIRQ